MLDTGLPTIPAHRLYLVRSDKLPVNHHGMIFRLLLPVYLWGGFSQSQNPLYVVVAKCGNKYFLVGRLRCDGIHLL